MSCFQEQHMALNYFLLVCESVRCIRKQHIMDFRAHISFYSTSSSSTFLRTRCIISFTYIKWYGSITAGSHFIEDNSVQDWKQISPNVNHSQVCWLLHSAEFVLAYPCYQLPIFNEDFQRNYDIYPSRNSIHWNCSRVYEKCFKWQFTTLLIHQGYIENVPTENSGIANSELLSLLTMLTAHGLLKMHKIKY